MAHSLIQEGTLNQNQVAAIIQEQLSKTNLPRIVRAMRKLQIATFGVAEQIPVGSFGDCRKIVDSAHANDVFYSTISELFSGKTFGVGEKIYRAIHDPRYWELDLHSMRRNYFPWIPEEALFRPSIVRKSV